MKFSHSLQFNAVPEWSSKYIAYSQLKKLVYTLQKDKLYQHETFAQDPERVPLAQSYIERFIAALDKELRRIDKFYVSQETGILANFQELKDDVEDLQREGLTKPRHEGEEYGAGGLNRRQSLSSASVANSEPEEEDLSMSHGLAGTPDYDVEPLLRRSSGADDRFLQQGILLKKRLVMAYTRLAELKSYFELNHTGFSKICKKFDKSLETNIRGNYMQSLPKKTHMFSQGRIEYISTCIQETIMMYASLIHGVNHDSIGPEELQEAEGELSLYLREHVVWERNTVWKDMMNIERKAQNVKSQKTYGRQATSAIEPGESKPFPEASNVFQLTAAELWGLLWDSPQLLKFFGITVVFAALLVIAPLADPLQSNCLAILVYASLLWATETVPLFVTSLLVPLLIVVFPVIRDEHTNAVMPAKDASQFILSSMWSSVIMLLLGGFTLAAALSKYNIAKVLSTHVLASAGTNPSAILLANMLVALFASMWVSNVAAPVLCYSLIQPLLRTMPRSSPFPKALILGIAMASNIGGMASPIASPQNIFAIGVMDPAPSWLQWFAVALPICAISIVFIWVLLLVTFPRDRNLKILRLHPISEPFTIQQWYVIAVTLVTIILWCLAKQISDVFGEMGIISIIPMVALFGTGLLDSDDFNNFMWTIVILAMGGSCLGKAVTSSGLLATMANTVKDKLATSPIISIVLIFGIVILTMATFVSHTVAAMIIIPLMKEIGMSLPSGDHSRLLIMVTALLCSAAMGLPTSGFPNVTAISIIDEVGDRYLNVSTFITRGVPASILTYLVIVTVGYTLMSLVGF
ncbi:ADR289Cp [Eremothecium gossypii ATCC 10895]|uniref:ADR289Cp n=1 Tax=Eremothecium gossypii (strain ATCC 10895 / CBS 109.51 / FGSC 9923 / NRRL Y-1056) TaxID=284811 RepID=Q759I8_EREGS|nr:ADR289Cp [Eremothecium gossypii ATCC 10895]AAS52209.2 ADR289Cp [Eremothecium gossypii ATCC 10895]